MQRQETNLHCLHIIMMKCHNLHSVICIIIMKRRKIEKEEENMDVRIGFLEYINKLEHENDYYMIRHDCYHMNLMHFNVLFVSDVI